MLWREVADYPSYKVSDSGLIFSQKANRLLTASEHGDGYKIVSLYKDGKCKRVFIHRLVYETFVGAIPEGMQINHKDEDKSNNSLDNLEIISHWDNCNYGTRNQRISKGLLKWRNVRGRAVYQYTSGGVLVRRWNSLAEAHDNGFHKSGISDCCNGRKKTYGSIVKVANVLSGMFRTAVRWQMIEVNPCTAAKVPKHKDEDNELKYYTPQQSLMFLRSLDLTFDTVIRGHQRIDDTGKPYLVADYTESHSLPLQLKVFYALSIYCGFRKGETLALHWSDIDFEKKTISITKSVGKTEDGVELKKPKTATSVRTVSFPDVILPLLKQYKKEYTTYRFELGTAWQGNGNLFVQADGKLMGRSTPYQSFKRHLKRYNDWVREYPTEAKKQGFEALPVIPLHGLRHSCATMLNYLEINIIDISKILGHAKSSTTMDIYAHSFEEQNVKAAKAIDDYVMNSQLMHA